MLMVLILHALFPLYWLPPLYVPFTLKTTERSITLSKKRNNAVKKHRPVESSNDNVVNISRRFTKKRHSQVKMIPQNTKQEELIDMLNNDEMRIVFAVGPAGTGKTMLSVLKAIDLFKKGDIEKIVITRPAVSVDEEHGFLPGTLVEKMAPWTRPIMDVFEDYYSPEILSSMIDENVIEIAPLAYMRGRTFKNSAIIFDESQNSKPSQMKMALTRIGTGSRMFVTGDLKQSDFQEENGLLDISTKLQDNRPDSIGACIFEKKHVARDPIVETVLSIYGEDV